MATLDFMMSDRLQRVLAAVLLDPERELILSDLIRRAGSGRGATQVLVDNLLKAGVVTDRRRGNHRLIRANEKHPLYPELRSMAVKTFGMADVIRRSLLRLGDGVELAFIFGSFAKGTDRPGSDIDLMVIGSVDLFAVTEALGEAERDLGRPIHPNVYGTDEWDRLRRDKVVARILDGPKIMVVGNEPGRDPEPEAGEPDANRFGQGGRP